MKQRSHAVLFGTKNKLRKASLIFASIDENKTKPSKNLPRSIRAWVNFQRYFFFRFNTTRAFVQSGSWPFR